MGKKKASCSKVGYWDGSEEDAGYEYPEWESWAETEKET